MRIPTLTLSPRSRSKRPRVIVVPGLGTPKEGGLTLLYMLARAGLCAVAVDARLHGERPDAPDRERILDSNFTQGMHHIIYDTAADIKLLMDHWGDWQEGIGMIGVSAGGFVGHVVATSDKRLKAAAIAISSPDWVSASGERALPVDSPAGQMMAALSPVNHFRAYAPLALLMMNGSADETVTSTGSLALSEKLAPLYKDQGISNRLEMDLTEGLGHQFNWPMQEKAVSWMVKWLLNE